MIIKNIRKILIAGCLLVGSFFFMGIVESAEVSGDIVLSGRVIFKEYHGGAITILVNKGGTTYGSEEFNTLNSVILNEPGDYSVSVPQNSGKVFLEAHIAKQDSTGPDYLAWGEYPANPLVIDTGNIGGLEIKMTDVSSGNKMSDYQGNKVMIKGRVAFDNYKNGPIFINASSAKGKKPDINSVSIASPGEYIMEVPVNAGTVYITAVNSDEVSRYSQKAIGGYEHPLEVGSSDIEGINIKLYEDVSSEINTMATITISGRISVDGFSGGDIHVGVGQLDSERPNINVVTLSSPGEYTLKVPKNIGPVYVTAEAGNQRKSYKNNPVLIENSDLQGIDIIF